MTELLHEVIHILGKMIIDIEHAREHLEALVDKKDKEEKNGLKDKPRV